MEAVNLGVGISKSRNETHSPPIRVHQDINGSNHLELNKLKNEERAFVLQTGLSLSPEQVHSIGTESRKRLEAELEDWSKFQKAASREWLIQSLAQRNIYRRFWAMWRDRRKERVQHRETAFSTLISRRRSFELNIFLKRWKEETVCTRQRKIEAKIRNLFKKRLIRSFASLRKATNEQIALRKCRESLERIRKLKMFNIWRYESNLQHSGRNIIVRGENCRLRAAWKIWCCRFNDRIESKPLDALTNAPDSNLKQMQKKEECASIFGDKFDKHRSGMYPMQLATSDLIVSQMFKDDMMGTAKFGAIHIGCSSFAAQSTRLHRPKKSWPWNAVSKEWWGHEHPKSRLMSSSQRYTVLRDWRVWIDRVN